MTIQTSPSATNSKPRISSPLINELEYLSPDTPPNSDSGYHTPIQDQCSHLIQSDNTTDIHPSLDMIHAAPTMIRKIRLAQVNKYFNKKDTLKWLTKSVPDLDTQPREWFTHMKVKKAPSSNFAFLTLPTPELHDKALQDLSTLTLICKNKSVEVKEYFEKERIFTPKPIDPNDIRTPLERVADQTTPLWRLPYDEQLVSKHTTMCSAIQNAFKKANVSPGNTDLLLPIPSPQLDGYRSKCEFQIGFDMDRVPTVGFNSGSFVSGNWASPHGLKHINPIMLCAVGIIEDFIRSKDLPVWDKYTKTGFFRLALMRTTSLNENMFILQLNNMDITPELCLKIEQEFMTFFMARASEANLSVNVLGVQYYSGSSDMFPEKEIKLLVGDNLVIQESVNGFKFNISPHSFFQTNQSATEKLYSLIGEWVQEDQTCMVDQDPTQDSLAPVAEEPKGVVVAANSVSTTQAKKRILLDLCCGTGTIGICLSDQFDHIYGIDIVTQAIADAEVNAKANNVSHVSYTASSVEKQIATLLKTDLVSSSDVEVIAVLDPPRAGIHKSVIQAVRQCLKIRRVVYISCDIQQVHATNVYDLIRAPTKSAPGVPFVLRRAQVVDLFPHTKSMEVVMEFYRDLVDGGDLE